MLIFQNSKEVTLSFIAVHIQLPLFLIIAILAIASIGLVACCGCADSAKPGNAQALHGFIVAVEVPGNALL